MKKIILVLICSVLPLTGIAGEEVNPNTSKVFSDGCDNGQDSAECQKDTLLVEKQKEAQQGFKNFQENNHNQQTF